MIQEILPNNWTVPWGEWEKAYVADLVANNKNVPDKFQKGSRAIYKQVFKSNVYAHIMKMYDKFRNYPLIPGIKCKPILACIAKETRQDLNAEVVAKEYADSSIKPEDFNSMNTDYMQELLRMSGARHLTVFEVLLVFYVHWLYSTSKQIRKYSILCCHQSKKRTFIQISMIVRFLFFQNNEELTTFTSFFRGSQR